VPPSKWEQARLVYELKRLEPTSAEDRAEFTEKLGHVLAPDAVDRLMAEIEPELEKARPQATGALLMAFGAMQLAVTSPESRLSDEQRAGVASRLARRAGMGQRHRLPQFRHDAPGADPAHRRGAPHRHHRSGPDQGTAAGRRVLDRATPLLAAAKQAVRLYGLDLDAVADSLQVKVLEIDGCRVQARVRTTVTLFGGSGVA
jgi:hypothetical protein